MRDISVEELARWRAEKNDFVLLDVREPSEIAAAGIGGSVPIPMRQIAERLNELDRAATIAVLCHHGGRSERVAEFLEAQGFAHVVNVAGGINEYALRVDPDIPIYS
ncbi:MAG: rhodanese-like domain-containing protein [Candidatus Eremiobacteraeota bacterium]|nr:rhodanese-like domain-containing protein [Candidatus Eremiobacteraeota bacterium]